jgi:hypothetical protein
VNFTFDTIPLVQELVIVVPDLYLPRELRGADEEAAALGDVPGIESAARFGTRTALAAGWRAWLLGRVGRAELEGVAPVCIAAAALEGGAAAAQPEISAAAATRWIATALHLRAGLTRLHLDHRGLLRLAAGEQRALAADFTHTFGSSGYSLEPLPTGEFLLSTPGLEAVATNEPARCAGRELYAQLPGGRATAPLRRLLAEIEMWLHAQPLNEARRLRGEPPVTSLWPWGAAGRIVRPEPRAQSEVPLAFGRDAWLEGLWRLQGAVCRPTPQRLEEVLESGTNRAVLGVEVAGQLRGEENTLGRAVSRLDERFVSPAVRALRDRKLARLTVVLNDACAQLDRGSLRRFWRRAPTGLAGFA